MTAEEVEACGLRGKIRALQENFRSASVESPADMSVIVALSKTIYGLGALGDDGGTGAA